MADPVDSLEQKVEYSFMAVLSDAGLEELAQFMCGHESEEQSGTYMVFTCAGGPEDAFGSGIYRQKLRLTYYTPAERDLANETTTEEPRQMHGNLVQKSREALSISNLVDELSEQEDDFTVFLVVHDGSDSGFDGRFMWTQDEFEVVCTRGDV